MSSYFDRFDKQVSELFHAHLEGGASIVKKEEWLRDLQMLESKMINDCELFAGDLETPDDVRQCIMAVIALSGVRVVDDNGRPLNSSSALRNVPLVADHAGTSALSRDMHRLFHDIARMKYQMRYGLVFDDPAAAVRRRDEADEERHRLGLRHPFQHTAPTSHLKKLQIVDAPDFCKKVALRSTF